MIKKKLAKLIDVKTFITISIIGGVTYGFITNIINSETYAAFASSIITYYFTRADKNKDGDENE